MKIDESSVKMQSAGKPDSWFTAFFNFAEEISSLTEGAVNHKTLYALVGTRGEYVNHQNSAIRVSTAPALSRLVHSSKYAADMRKRYEEDGKVFKDAAHTLHGLASNSSCLDDEGLLSYLRGSLWETFERGLANEEAAGRSDVKIFRIRKEAQNLFAHVSISMVDNPGEAVESILECYFYIMAFGHLDASVAHNLVSETPLDAVFSSSGVLHAFETACLMKVYHDGAIGGICCLEQEGSLLIGRYTDCDIIETNTCVSRRHCKIFCNKGQWFIEDCGSKYGTIIVRKNMCIYDSLSQGPCPVPLEYDDYIILGGNVRYTLAALRLPHSAGAAFVMNEYAQIGRER